MKPATCRKQAKVSSSYFAVANAGAAPQALSFFSTSVTGMAGRRHNVEPHAGYLSAAQPVDAYLPPDGRMSGNRRYMLPANAGDLFWTGVDASRNRVTFAVTTNDIVALRER